ncbi:MAG: ABC transporter ATP-binding protein [Firmicutes bacterium]|nr:ABC transporter ATP-binding protein [Bacillota bacterium]
MLVVKDLTKIYQVGPSQVRAVNGINLEIRSGETVAVMGPSGSGKTTLLHLIAGLERPDNGSIQIGGSYLHKMSDASISAFRARFIGFIFQAFNLIPTLTALENVELARRIAGLRDAKKHAAELLERVDLGERTKHKPGQLSGGEQQRVAIARALVNNPALILADEPTGELDSESSRGVIDILLTAVRERGSACILVTHNPDVADVADRVFTMRDGRLQEK